MTPRSKRSMASKRNDRIQAYITAGKNAGCPPDQIKRFLKALYIATPQQLLFHAAARRADTPGNPNVLGVGGTRGSAKTHGIIAQVAIDDCQRFPGLKVLFLRKTQKAAGEQFQDLMQKITRHIVGCKLDSEKAVYKNGSKIIIGGYKDERDIDNFIGQEYDSQYLAEATQLPGGRLIKIEGSKRTSKSGWRTRTYIDFNPGGVGFQEVKDLLINPWRAKTETKTKFFETWYQDNPFIDDDYREYLEGLTGYLRRIWVLNDWDVAAGQALKELNRNIHGFADQIPAHWPRYISLDYGFSHPWAAGFFAIDYDGRIWMYDEIYGWGGEPDTGAEESLGKIAKRIIDRMALDGRTPKDYNSIYAGPDWFAKDKDMSEDMARAGLHLTEVTTPGGSRIDRKGLLHNRLAGDKEHTSFKIHTANCTHTWRTLPTLTYKEGTEDIDTTQEDHLWDLILLMISQWTAKAKTPPAPARKLTRAEKLAKIKAAEGTNKPKK